MSRVWDENNFEDRLKNLEASWRSAEKHGRPRSEAEKVWDRLSLELEFSGNEQAVLTNIALWGRLWVEEQNPHYIDLAYLACRHAGIELPHTLLRLMDEVAETRFRGVQKYGTGKSIRDQNQLSEALRIICGLHIAGASVGDAAQKVAQMIVDRQMGKPLKSSTLERRYAEQFRKGEPSIEDTMRDGMSAENLQGWQELLAQLPDADEERVGNRRN